ncbi:hypothetical protein J4558_03955 [Leptolyngbya sp. 15MV]|nr:hypothetical protein J4558_03955 [Leptolyngbya sp. 15MV]
MAETVMVHLAGALLVGSMLMTSMRRLRVLALLGGLVALLHLAMTGAFGAMHVWLVLFVAANAVQLAVLLYRARTGDLGREERELLEHVLQVEEPSRQRRLLGLRAFVGAWRAERRAQERRAHRPGGKVVDELASE